MALADPIDLLPIAESIADGSAIDWDKAESQAGHDSQGIVRQLRILSELAALHRSQPDPDQTHDVMPGRRATAAPAMGKWAHLDLIERLGGGSFADVYRAWDRHLERDVALKLLRIDEALADPLTSRVTAEGRLLAKVRHPNVVAVHGVAVHNGRVGLWMELVRGTTLEDRLKAQGPFSAREAALVGIDLCRALAAIHAAGLLHRDVKAQNVMREAGGRIVLMDLGTGRAIDRSLSSSDMAGTPLYLAPELFGGGTAGEGTDLYSLGVLLYHLVTGSFPVRAATVDELRAAHAKGAAVRLRDARADLPTAFVRVVERAIATDPERRYASAGALEADLGHALDEAAASAVAADVAVPASVAEPRRPGISWSAWGFMGVAAAAVITFAVAGWPAFVRRGPSGPVVGTIRSIAVLPLTNASGDPSQEYFADGMTDELIGTLATLPGVTVISRTSAMQFKGSGKPLPEIARALHVDAVLEGSVMLLPGSGGPEPNTSQRVRVNARLIHAGTDTRLWDRTFERVTADVRKLQSEIAGAVAEDSDARLTAPARAMGLSSSAAESAQAQDFAVFDLYLRGRYYWNMRTEPGFNQSIQYFREALDRDPSYAPAYAGLADAYHLLGVYDLIPRSIAVEQSLAAATKALELDGSLAEAHASLGSIRYVRFEWDAAEAEYQRAIELKPGYASAHHWYATYLTVRGRFPDALREIGNALALDPLSISINTEYGIILMLARRYDEAIAQLQKSVLLNPAVGRTHTTLVDAYAHHGEYDLALAEAEKARVSTGRSPEVPAAIGYVQALRGRRRDALRIANELAARYQRSEDETAGAVASIYAALGDRDRAFEWLDRSRQRREAWVAYLGVDPKFDKLHSDTRFTKMLASIGLAQ